MLKVLIPDLYVSRIAEIPLEELVEKQISGLIIDLDNTVTEWNALEVHPEVIKWFETLVRYNFKVCLVSNNQESRVLVVAEKLGIPFIFKAGKPRAKAFHKALKVLGTEVYETAVIGDQIFTDILGANKIDLYSILVVPLSKKEFIGTRCMRRLERIVLRRLAAKGVVSK